MTEPEKTKECKEPETKCEKKRAPEEPECPDYVPETPTPSPSIPSALIPNLHFFMVDDRGKAVAEFTLKNIVGERRGPSQILALSNPDNVVPELQRMNRDQLTSFANSIEEIAVRAREFMARFNGHGTAEEKPAVTPPAPPKPVAAEKPAKPRRGSRKPRDVVDVPNPAPAPAPAKPTAPAPTVPSQPAKPPTTPPPQAPAKDDLDDLEREIMVYLDGSSGMSFGDISQKTNQKGKPLFTAIQSLMTKKLVVKGEDMLFRRVDH